MKRTVKRTKIIATLGPATDDPSVLKQMIQEGVDVVRINFSHQNMESQVKRVEQVRQVATELDIPVGIIGDLQGPKIRVSTFKNDRVELVAANHADITAIVALTESGATPLRMSRIRTAIPIYALCRHWTTLGKMALFKNVYPIFFEFSQDFGKNISGKMISLLRQRKLMGQSDLAMGNLFLTNSLKYVNSLSFEYYFCHDG